ncbi:hypothetical protein D3C86_1705190 [compost metagenome]
MHSLIFKTFCNLPFIYISLAGFSDNFLEFGTILNTFFLHLHTHQFTCQRNMTKVKTTLISFNGYHFSHFEVMIVCVYVKIFT